MAPREEGILILSGGLTAHNLRDRSSFAPDTARPVHKEFDLAIHQAIGLASVRKMYSYNLCDFRN